MGLKLLLDTNAAIALLKNDREIVKLVSASSEIYLSIISELEFASFTNLSSTDLSLFNTFTERVNVVDLNHSHHLLKNKICEIRKSYRLKLPDAIIAASAIMSNCLLVSADKEFAKIKELKLADWTFGSQ